MFIYNFTFCHPGLLCAGAKVEKAKFPLKRNPILFLLKNKHTLYSAIVKTVPPFWWHCLDNCLQTKLYADLWTASFQLAQLYNSRLQCTPTDLESGSHCKMMPTMLNLKHYSQQAGWLLLLFYYYYQKQVLYTNLSFRRQNATFWATAPQFHDPVFPQSHWIQSLCISRSVLKMSTH